MKKKGNHHLFSLSEYSYEYSTALLMNLSLRSAGKTYCENPDYKVLQVLNELLEHDNQQVRTFVNGMLYSLLSRKSIREEAHKMGMQDILNYLMQNSDERFTKQIMYIQDQLNKDDDDDTLSDQNEEDNDADDMDEDDQQEEEEDDLDEEPQIPNQSIQGNDLLQQEFCMENQSRNAKLRSNKIPVDLPFQRPITPALMKNPSINLSHMQHSQVSQQQQQPQNQPSQSNQQAQIDQSQIQQDIPEELQSRPRIARTPVENVRPKQPQIQIRQPQTIETQIQPQQIKDNDIEDVFASRPKIPRSPR